MNIENEVPKHKKKKESTTSKSKVKSKHKHEYVDGLLICKGKPHRATYCKICGKINDVQFFEVEKVEGKPYYRQLDYDEVFEKYKDLEQFVVEDVFQKFVALTENN